MAVPVRVALNFSYWAWAVANPHPATGQKHVGRHRRYTAEPHVIVIEDRDRIGHGRFLQGRQIAMVSEI